MFTHILYRDMSDSITREHLYCCHIIYQCPRCKVQFEREDDLDQHHRSAEACLLSNAHILEGIGKYTIQRLRRMKRDIRATDEDQWNNIFILLFPDAAIDSLPSPCKFTFVSIFLQHVAYRNGEETVLTRSKHQQTLIYYQ